MLYIYKKNESMHESNAGGNSLIIFCFHKNLWFVNQTPCHSVTEPCGSYEYLQTKSS